MKSKFSAAGGLAILAVTVLLLVSGLGACASAPKAIPEGLSAPELIQKAQEASDVYNYSSAARYYKTALERFGSTMQIRATCEYELAFIAYKQGRTEEARTGMTALLALYEQPGNEGLPPTYKILAQKVLDKLPKPKAKPAAVSPVTTTTTVPVKK